MVPATNATKTISKVIATGTDSASLSIACCIAQPPIQDGFAAPSIAALLSCVSSAPAEETLPASRRAPREAGDSILSNGGWE